MKYVAILACALFAACGESNECEPIDTGSGTRLDPVVEWSEPTDCTFAITASLGATYRLTYAEGGDGCPTGARGQFAAVMPAALCDEDRATLEAGAAIFIAPDEIRVEPL